MGGLMTVSIPAASVPAAWAAAGGPASGGPLGGEATGGSRWQVQEAKQKFSEVLRAAEAGEPQIVTRHGAEVAVIIDVSEYRHLRGETASLMDYLIAGPHLDDDVDLEVERDRGMPREIELSV
jgi:prevent-host-death family protein